MLVRGVAAVEDVETFTRAAAWGFLARTFCDPVRAGVAGADDPVLAVKGALSSAKRKCASQRTDTLGASGAGTHIFAKSLFMTEVKV